MNSSASFVARTIDYYNSLDGPVLKLVASLIFALAFFLLIGLIFKMFNKIFSFLANIFVRRDKRKVEGEKNMKLFGSRKNNFYKETKNSIVASNEHEEKGEEPIIYEQNSSNYIEETNEASTAVAHVLDTHFDTKEDAKRSDFMEKPETKPIFDNKKLSEPEKTIQDSISFIDMLLGKIERLKSINVSDKPPYEKIVFNAVSDFNADVLNSNFEPSQEQVSELVDLVKEKDLALLIRERNELTTRLPQDNETLQNLKATFRETVKDRKNLVDAEANTVNQFNSLLEELFVKNVEVNAYVSTLSGEYNRMFNVYKQLEEQKTVLLTQLNEAETSLTAFLSSANNFIASAEENLSDVISTRDSKIELIENLKNICADYDAQRVSTEEKATLLLNDIKQKIKSCSISSTYARIINSEIETKEREEAERKVEQERLAREEAKLKAEAKRLAREESENNNIDNQPVSNSPTSKDIPKGIATEIEEQIANTFSFNFEPFDAQALQEIAKAKALKEQEKAKIASGEKVAYEVETKLSSALQEAFASEKIDKKALAEEKKAEIEIYDEMKNNPPVRESVVSQNNFFADIQKQWDEENAHRKAFEAEKVARAEEIKRRKMALLAGKNPDDSNV